MQVRWLFVIFFLFVPFIDHMSLDKPFFSKLYFFSCEMNCMNLNLIQHKLIWFTQSMQNLYWIIVYSTPLPVFSLNSAFIFSPPFSTTDLERCTNILHAAVDIVCHHQPVIVGGYVM